MTRSILIPLTKGMFARIDEADAHLVRGYRWRADRPNGKRFYAVAEGPRVGGRRAQISMHRLLLGAAAGVLVDHADGDGLNNCRSNIRLCNYSQNNANAARARKTRGGRGVYIDRKKFRARIKVNNRYVSLGGFATEAEAADAYNRAAIQQHGEFARLNPAGLKVLP